MVRHGLKMRSGQGGFSLVELMIVVAIIGILAGLAVPKFNLFQAKARQSEAQANLSNIYTLQQSYFGSNDVYMAFSGVKKDNCSGGAALGFVPGNCKKLRYEYASTAAGATFRATAIASYASIYPGCSVTGSETWETNQIMESKVTSNSIDNCGGH